MAVEDRLLRALAVLRWVVLVNAVGLNLWRHDNFVHPWAGIVVVLVLVAWTAYATWAYRDAARRTTWLLAADLAIAVGAILVSPVVKGEQLRATIPGFWVMGALLAWAVHYRWRGGLFAGACLAAADLAIRDQITQSNYGNVFLLLVGGPIVGYMCETLQLMGVERDRAERAAAAAEERTRLARAVHDGVLQVLALMQRRGAEAGGDLAELGRMAGEQESALRSLIRQQDSVPAEAGEEGEVDLAAELERLEAARPPVVSVATPGTPVLLPAVVVREVVAVVSACLDNVARHVGLEAPAWVLLEQISDEVVVTVRDEGLGIPEGRLDAAAAEGRLGVRDSILGRVAELGGRAELVTGGDGTEWELTFPLDPARPAAGAR
ncbi:MacS family sensor histidine kinase [Nocardioides sp.]|uniref:MacS family sensor histidine kinase n=1 Tax=Nocardioides sp. TaxID=35761 RepID=UPI003528CE1D